MYAFLMRQTYGIQGTETTIAHLPSVKLKALSIPAPPIEEQRAIAHLLRTVQRTKEATEKVIAATRQLKASLMRHLFTYGPVSFKQADRVPLKQGQFGPAAEHWELLPLAEAVAEIDYGLSAPIPKTRPVSGIKVVSTADLTKDGKVLYAQIRDVEAPPRTVERLTLRSGDLLFNWRNSPELIGKTAIFNGQTEPHIFASFILRIRLDERKSHNEFLKYLLNYYRERGVFLLLARRAVNQTNYNRNEISVLEIPLPPIEEQHEIARQLVAADGKLEAEIRQRAGLESLFRTLLHHLMTGKLRVKDLDPTDHSHDGTAAG